MMTLIIILIIILCTAVAHTLGRFLTVTTHYNTAMYITFFVHHCRTASWRSRQRIIYHLYHFIYYTIWRCHCRADAGPRPDARGDDDNDNISPHIIIIISIQSWIFHCRADAGPLPDPHGALQHYNDYFTLFYLFYTVLSILHCSIAQTLDRFLTLTAGAPGLVAVHCDGAGRLRLARSLIAARMIRSSLSSSCLYVCHDVLPKYALP